MLGRTENGEEVDVKLLEAISLMEMNCIHLILLVLLVLSCSSNGVAATSSSSSQVNSLPGFEGPLPFQLETGYIGVDDLNEVQLFYYFIQSERNPREDPLLLWHTGGPGCSAFSGLVFEIGPLRYNVAEYNGSLPTFVLNPYSWTKVSSIIFLDAPVGTGFSYSTSSEGQRTSDTKSAKQTYSFLRKWLNDHIEFSNNPLYVGGDSYTGKVIPAIVQEIADGIQAQHLPPINLKGYLLGNPVTEINFDSNSKITFAHRMSFISDELYESLQFFCKGDYTNVNSRDIECAKRLQAASECTKELNVDHVLEPWCPVRLLLNDIGDQRRSLEGNSETSFSETQFPLFGCRKYSYLLSIYWANDDSVRDALHIRKGTIGEWRRCRYVSESDLYVKDVKNAVPYHMNLSKRGYPSLIFSGDHDMMVPYIGTHAWIKSLNFSIIDDWRPWFVNTQVAGFTRTYSNRMTFATVKGAGHAAPEYMPKECLAMFTRWVAQNPL